MSTCKYNVYQKTGAPTQRIYDADLRAQREDGRNPDAEREVRAWVSRNLREWPTCNYGNTVELRYTRDMDSSDAEFYFFCPECAKKERDSFAARIDALTFIASGDLLA